MKFLFRMHRKKGDVFSPLLLNFAVECAISKVEAKSRNKIEKKTDISVWSMLAILIYWAKTQML
jgi:hypothetical protein